VASNTGFTIAWNDDLLDEAPFLPGPSLRRAAR
jgi:hypothetical protein